MPASPTLEKLLCTRTHEMTPCGAWTQGMRGARHCFLGRVRCTTPGDLETPPWAETSCFSVCQHAWLGRMCATCASL